jgi:hypothetical protein
MIARKGLSRPILQLSVKIQIGHISTQDSQQLKFFYFYFLLKLKGDVNG